MDRECSSWQEWFSILSLHPAVCAVADPRTLRSDEPLEKPLMAQLVEAESVDEESVVEAESVDRTDGVSMAFGNWRFNLRASNTEPVIRLNVESRGDTQLMQEKTAELLALIDTLG